MSYCRLLIALALTLVVPRAGFAQAAVVVKIPVKVLVDDEEKSPQRVWRQRLTDRVKAASELLEKQCGVRLEVVATGTWDSDDRTTDITRSLAEFEKQVLPEPARLAIGFSSQYEATRGRFHLGGTRGPLHTHILIRESGKGLSEAERLEVLLHEVGHILGATHSGRTDSVMRPILGDQQARLKKFEIRYDEANLRVMKLVASEMGGRGAKRLADLSADTRGKLRESYSAMSQALPNDPAAPHYLKLLEAAQTPPKR